MDETTLVPSTESGLLDAEVPAEWAASATDRGGQASTEEGGQIGRALNSTENRGPLISVANERETAGPSTMMARLAALE